jgi:hypothetical protein
MRVIVYVYMACIQVAPIVPSVLPTQPQQRWVPLRYRIVNHVPRVLISTPAVVTPMYVNHVP